MDKAFNDLEELRRDLRGVGVLVKQAGGLAKLSAMKSGQSLRIARPVKFDSYPGGIESVGRHSFFGPRCEFEQVSSIGAFCAISMDIKIGGAEHPMQFLSMNNVFFAGKAPTAFLDDDLKFMADRAALNRKAHVELKAVPTQKTSIGNDVWIGARATIKRGVSVGDGAVIAAGAVVTRDVAPYEVVGGVPAKRIRYRFEDDQIRARLTDLKWWEMPDSALVDIDATDVEGSISKLEDRKAALEVVFAPIVSITRDGQAYRLTTHKA